MALRIVERHLSTRQLTALLYRPKKNTESNFVRTIKSRKELIGVRGKKNMKQKRKNNLSSSSNYLQAGTP